MFNKFYFLFLCIGTLIKVTLQQNITTLDTSFHGIRSADYDERRNKIENSTTLDTSFHGIRSADYDERRNKIENSGSTSPETDRTFYCTIFPYRTIEIYEIDGTPVSPYSKVFRSFYLKVRCPPGYKLIGNKVGRCLNGVYVVPTGSCYRIDENVTESTEPGLLPSLCEVPDHPKHGSYVMRGTSHPDIIYAYYEFDITFKCNYGYELRGRSFLTCYKDSPLLHDIPTCVPKYGYLVDPLETGIRRSLTYCKAPDTPKHGSYTIQGDEHPDIPNAYTKLFIEVTCNKNYQILGEDLITCRGGRWSAEMPLCGLPCHLKKDPRVEYLCETKDGSVCDDYVSPGEIVTPICNDNITRDDITVMRCGENGYFDHIVTCEREDIAVACGLVTVSDGLIIGGFKVERGEVPWHAGIYTKNTNPYMQLCGGTIVTSTSIISAAHCFWTDKTNTLPPSNYAVAVGKIYRPYNEPHDIHAQKSEVMDIKIPTLYFGSSANYQNDLAVVKLVTAIEFNRFVRPICLDSSEVAGTNQQDDVLRKVAGWGLKTQEGEASQVLKAVFLPIVDLEKCSNESPYAFKPYITSDKICAGYTNGTAVCKGDSGGGLTYHRVENGVYKHYLQGVVSTAPNYGLQQCNAFTWATFTSVVKHIAFIYSNIV